MTPRRTRFAIPVGKAAALGSELGPLAVAFAICAFAGCGGATDPRPASWSYVSAAITQPNCATVSCHSRATAEAGLDFSDAQRGFTSLTGLWIWIVDPTGTAANGCRDVGGTTVCQREHRSLVVPFDPAQSRLVHMLRAEGAPRMPPDRPLAEGDIRLVENWILNGAIFDSASGGGPSDAATADATVDAPDAGSSDAGSPGGDAIPNSDGASTQTDALSDGAGTETRPTDGGPPG